MRDRDWNYFLETLEVQSPFGPIRLAPYLDHRKPVLVLGLLLRVLFQDEHLEVLGHNGELLLDVIPPVGQPRDLGGGMERGESVGGGMERGESATSV